MKYLITLIILISIPDMVFSQVNELWVNRFDSVMANNSFAKSMCVDAQGNVYITGSAFTPPGGYNFLIIKYNSSGAEQWVRTYNGNYIDEAFAITVDNDGNVYATGRSQATSIGNYDFATVKYNSNGVEQWVRRYNGPGNNNDAALAIEIDNSGNIYVGGHSNGGNSATRADFTLIKYNPSGDTLWVRRYDAGFNRDDFMHAMKLDSQGNVYLVGSSYKPSISDFTTIKYNSNGDIQWVQSYDSPIGSGDAAVDVAIDSLGNVYVVGESIDSGSDYATIKYSPSGDELWVRRYTNTFVGGDYPHSIALDNAGGVYVTGQSQGSSVLGTNGSAYATIKYNSNGDFLWVKRYNGYNSETLGIDARALDMVIDAEGYIYVTGESHLVGEGFDYVTVKYAPNGDTVWTKRYDGPYGGNDRPTTLFVDNSGNIYLKGQSEEASGTFGYAYATIKYSQKGMSITPITGEIPHHFELFQNYPNPFNPETNIKFNITKSGMVKLKVFDILGKELATLVNNELQAGQYKVDFNGATFPSGVYFYSLETDVFRDMKKMMLVK